MFIFVLMESWAHAWTLGIRLQVQSTRSDRRGLIAIGPNGIVHRGIKLAQIMRLSHWVRTLGIVFRTYARIARWNGGVDLIAVQWGNLCI
jgi:hypothetical protein